ncbi:MAG: SpoIIE family protein phosphatase [Anaerolineales bacterium]|nr:SpoIIE family protein phosphatase [Anaerolineales bacterium]
MEEASLQGFAVLRNPTRHRHFAAGEAIFYQGDQGDDMYIVVAGELRVTLDDNEINRLTSGAVFGEMSLVDERTRSATVTAVTDCTLIPVSQTRFAELAQQDPDFAIQIMRIMSIRLRNMMAEEVERQRLEQELAIGRQIQLSLLPQNTPQIPGWEFAVHYQAARQVGGDLYDFMPAPANPHQLHIVVADVTGKGVPAAMFMAVGRTLFRATAADTHAPAHILHRVNESILRDNHSPLFLSACYITLDTQTGVLRHASAGHEAPLWLHGETGAVTELPGRGMVLGAFKTVAFAEETAVLAPGDALIIYTDGVTEARDTTRGFFGDERLTAAIAAARGARATELVQQLVTAVTHFTGDMPQADDLTIVVIKRL